MKKRKDGRFCKKITLPDGNKKFFYSSEPTESKAESDIQKQLILYTGESSSGKHNFKVLADAMIDAKSAQVSYSTLQTYTHALKHLSSFFGKDIENITPAMLQLVINNMAAQGLSRSAISKTKITFGLVMDHAILEGCNVSDFTTAIKIPRNIRSKKITAVNDDIIRKINDNKTVHPFGMWAFMLLCTGMRRGELAALTVDDIDFKKNTIKIWRSVEYIGNVPHLKDMPKSENSIRTIPIFSMLLPSLSEYCRDMPSSAFLFGGDKPLTVSMINKRWKRYCSDIGIGDIHMHQLRHTYAFIMYRAGIDPKTTQGLMGHADIQTTMNIYTDFAEDLAVDSVSRADQFLSDIVSES